MVSKGHAHNKTREGKRSSFIVEILQEHAAGRKTKRGSIFEKIVLKESGVATRTRKVTKTQFVNGIPDQSAGTKREEGSSSNTFMIPNPVVDALDTPSVGADDADIDYVLNTIEKYTSATHQTMDVQRFGSQIVFRQSVLYTLAFYVSFTFATINRLVSQVSGETYFALLFLHVLLLPLQGFFNIFVYRYGFYLRLKQRHPEMTQWELCRHTYRWTFLGPPPGSTTVRSTVYESTNSHNNNNNPKIGRMATHTGSRNISGDIDSLQRSVILEDSDEASMPDDGLGTIHLEDFVADMMYSYSEFPNTVANDDTEVVIRSYPTMVEDFSSVNFTSME